MTKYRKKPVVIDAEQVVEGQCFPFAPKANYTSNNIGNLVFDSLHDSWVRFEVGDWIIKGIKGEFYPCKPDVFEATYELAPLPEMPRE